MNAALSHTRSGGSIVGKASRERLIWLRRTAPLTAAFYATQVAADLRCLLSLCLRLSLLLPLPMPYIYF